MKAFRDRVMRQALVELVKEAELSRPWLPRAREALENFLSVPPDADSAKRLGRELGAIEPWPADFSAELEALAEPIKALLSDAFCRVVKDKSGQESALIWGGAGRISVEAGELNIERQEDGPLPALPASILFMTSDWNGPAAERKPMEMQERLAAVNEERKARGSLIYLDDFSEGIVLSLLGVRQRSSEEHWEIADRLHRVLDTLGHKKQSADETQVAESAALTRGLARAGELAWLVVRLNSSVLRDAGVSASKRLEDFLRSWAPSLGLANATAERLWGAPLSIEAAATAGAWTPLADQLLKEDPRRAALAFAVAPGLGLFAQNDLLSRAKGELKKMGLPDSVWKELGALPASDFDGVLDSFKAAANRGRETQIARDVDPFRAPRRDEVSERALREIVRRLELTSRAARLADVTLSAALGLCSHRMDLSPVWGGRVKEAQEGAGWGRAEQTAAARLADACARASLEGPVWADPAALEAERAAALAKGPKALALAFKEAQSRPLLEAMAEVSDVTDWITRSEFGIWQQLPDKMSWASLRRRQEAWHRELSLSSSQEFGSPWTVLLEKPVETEGRLARELATGAELFEEGKAMRHCVSSYAQDCREGSSRIYSIANAQDGSRVATLEVKFLAAETEGAQPIAKQAQLRGVCNQRVTDSGALKASEAVVAALNEKLAARAKVGPEGGGALVPAKLMSALIERRRAGAADAPAGPLGRRPD